MKINWRDELPQILLMLGMLIAAVVCWSRVPEKVPVHWNLAGEVDRYGSRFEGLLLLPLIAIGLYALMLFLPRIDPSKANYPGFWKTYGIMRFAIMLFLAVIYAASVATSFGYEAAMGRVIPISVGALFAVLGNYLGKLRPNWFVGVRTPWTLSSKKSWAKTHRLAGWCFVLFGCMMVAFGIIGGTWLFGVLLAVGAGLLIWIVVYSYIVWRNDPDRLPSVSAASHNDA